MPRSISLPPPPQPSSGGGASRGLIYFIPGNPGYIEYYRDFLVALRSIIDSAPPSSSSSSSSAPSSSSSSPSPPLPSSLFGPTFHIYGRDLAGFQDDDHAPFGPENPPVDVDGQIAATREILGRMTFAEGRERRGEKSRGAHYDFIVLAGHSVGAFISLSLIDRNGASGQPLPLAHGILLFPTISHIALSPRGRIAAPLLHVLPASILAQIARALVRPWPTRVLRWAIGWLLGMEDRAATVTAEFLCSRDGVWQALGMAADEMRVISEERWGDRFWGGSDGDEGERGISATEKLCEGGGVVEMHKGRRVEGDDGNEMPRFYMYFGAKDGWVDDVVRDEFIGRTASLGRVRAVVDDHGLPHSFCTTEFNSVIVASMIRGWILAIRDEFTGRRGADRW